MSATLTSPVRDFLAKCDVIFQLADKDRLDPANTLHQQPFAKAGVYIFYIIMYMQYILCTHLRA